MPMDKYMKDKWVIILDMDMGLWDGKKVEFIKDNGVMTMLMDKADSNIMEINIMVYSIIMILSVLNMYQPIN